MVVVLPATSKDALKTVKSEFFPPDDRNLLDEARHYETDFSEVLLEGRFSTEVDNVTFECLLKRSETEKLYVFLSGGRWRGGVLSSYPSFSRWNYYKLVDGNALFIDDPMYSAYPDLVTGWFYGTQKKDYRKVVSKLIMKVAENLGVAPSDIVIYSSLANTSASIHVGSFIPGCKVMAINPVIDLTQTNESQGFKKRTGINLKDADKLNRNYLYDVMFNSECTYVLACNIRSVEDYEKQIIPLFEMLGVTPQYGLNKLSDSIFVWLYDASDTGSSAHNSADSYELFPMINYVLTNLDSLDYRILQEFVVSVGNPLWFNHFNQKKLRNQRELSCLN